MKAALSGGTPSRGAFWWAILGGLSDFTFIKSHLPHLRCGENENKWRYICTVYRYIYIPASLYTIWGAYLFGLTESLFVDMISCKLKVWCCLTQSPPTGGALRSTRGWGFGWTADSGQCTVGRVVVLPRQGTLQCHYYSHNTAAEIGCKTEEHSCTVPSHSDVITLTNAHTHTHTHTSTYMHAYTHTQTHAHTHVHTHKCTHKYALKYRHKHTHQHTFMLSHTHTHAWV